jgi:calcium-translocating P-type ATPase
MGDRRGTAGAASARRGASVAAAGPAPVPARGWHTLAAAEVQDLLETQPAGLTTAEAAARLARYGSNILEAEGVEPSWRLLLRQFRDPLIYILLIAAGVTTALRDYTDAGVILAVVLINATIGFVQELRARKAIRGLARLSAPRADVVRDGTVHAIESRELVPGDVVSLSSGASVPADLRLVIVQNLEIDESMLTGESAPVRKHVQPLQTESLVAGDQLNLGFAGTVVTRGRGRGIVIRTGAATEIGRIATAIRRVGTTATPLQDRIHHFGRRVGAAIMALSVVVLVLGLLQGLSPADIFLTAVALAVSAVPEGLPVVMTVTLAIGVARMARRRAIIRSLPAVETLGSTTVIGSDKTGTLTRNEMTVRTIVAGDGVFDVADAGFAAAAAAGPPLHRTLLAGILANESDAASVERGEPHGDPTETALHVAALHAGYSATALRDEYPELDVLPFEPERRFMATLNRTPAGRHVIHIKGAPEVVIARCSSRLTLEGEVPIDRSAATLAIRPLSARGLRVLAMAHRVTEASRLDDDLLRDGFVLAGAQGMEDPVRAEAVAAVAAAHEAGIRVLMLTGDHVDTAQNIGRQLGLGGTDAHAVDGHTLDHLSDAELDRLIGDVDIYARVAPEHKLRLVQRLKARGETVAVTGDGVNDAPALRAAHIGIAMGRSGTDVAREAADMILADDNFATITAAIEEGRTVFGNVRKVSFFLLSTAAGEVITILAALFAGWPLPFLAAQILWINLVTNGLQDVALAFEKGEPGLLQRPPRPRGEGIVTLRILERLGAVGLVLAAGTLFVFWLTLDRTGDLAQARTIAVTQMVVFQFFHVFNSRSLDRSILSIPLFSNRFLFVSIVAAAAAHVAVLHVGVLQHIFRTVPLTASEWLLVVMIGSTAIIGGELDKWRNRARGRLLG